MLRRVYESRIRLRDDPSLYVVRVYGERASRGRWEAWLEFVDAKTGDVLLTGRETTQPDLAKLRYWAQGLGPAYLEGAFARAKRRLGVPITRRRLRFGRGSRGREL